LLKNSLQALARIGSRQHQEFQVIEERALATWAEQHGLSKRQAYQQALAAGIFPESLERNFPTLSIQEQLHLWRSRVLVVGLGGLGGYQAQLLGRLGTGTLILADGDRFTPANLNRQLLATTDSLGKSKARITAEFIQRLNPALEVRPVEEYLDETSYPVYFSRVDLALDALDTIAGRRLLLAAARRAGKPLIHGAVLGQDGQVTTIFPEDSPDFESRYLSQAALAASPPVLAPVVCTVAGLQVQEAVRLLLGRPLAYHGRLAYLDGDTGCLEIFSLR
jgi:molybdopterin/thiamine biosynthesis adenylyltransferase